VRVNSAMYVSRVARSLGRRITLSRLPTPQPRIE
jgi:hypothetical protein